MSQTYLVQMTVRVLVEGNDPQDAYEAWRSTVEFKGGEPLDIYRSSESIVSTLCKSKRALVTKLQHVAATRAERAARYLGPTPVLTEAK